MPHKQNLIHPKGQTELDGWIREIMYTRFVSYTIKISGITDVGDNDFTITLDETVDSIDEDKFFNANELAIQTLAKDAATANTYFDTDSNGKVIIIKNVEKGPHGTARPLFSIAAMLLNPSEYHADVKDAIPTIRINGSNQVEFYLRDSQTSANISFSALADGLDLYYRLTYMIFTG